MSAQAFKRVLLLGGGLAHLHGLASMVSAPLANARVTLVSPFARSLYSGMLPGWIAGHYAREDCEIALDALSARADVDYRSTAAISIDPRARVVAFADGGEQPYDVLSIDTGPATDVDALPGAREHAIPVRPLETFAERWIGFRERLNAKRRSRIVIVGAGAAGVELALAVRRAFVDRADIDVTLISGMPALPGATGARLHRLIGIAGIQFIAETFVTRVGAASVHLGNDTALDADAVFLSTGPAAAGWIRRSGLEVDLAGFLVTDTTLRVNAHPEVFATGDCATVQGHPRPKSGVYSLRAGPLLLANLRRTLSGEPLLARVPQRRSLHLVSAGDRYAVGSWGGIAFEGAWVWRWKDRIDRAFIARHRVSDR